MKLLNLTIAILFLTLITMGCISPDVRSARIAVNEKDWDRALKSLDAELARVPGNPEAYYLKGLCFEKQNDWENMAFYYDSSLAVSDLFKDKITENRKRILYRFLSRVGSAFDSTRWANAQDSLKDDSEALDKFDKDRHRTALVNIDTALIVDPLNNDIIVRAAIIAYDGKFYNRAIKYTNRAIDLDKDNADIAMYEIQMLSHRELGNAEKVIKWAQKTMNTIDMDNDDQTIYLRAFDALIEAAEKLEKMDIVLETTREAMEKFPDNVFIKKNLAVLMVRNKEYDKAKAIYDEVIAKNPEDFDANITIGTIFANAEKHADAIPYLEKAHELDPKNKVAVQNLMAAYYNTGNDEKGMEMMLKLKELPGELPGGE
ncbi:MAG: tetratricopeptide repeat protein [Candidatus Hatepunaea meridiana]|nr:tetratricopeptide repeat protein [Candidatus Hatepunaea meridiana]